MRRLLPPSYHLKPLETGVRLRVFLVPRVSAADAVLKRDVVLPAERGEF